MRSLFSTSEYDSFGYSMRTDVQQFIGDHIFYCSLPCKLTLYLSSLSYLDKG